MFRWRRCCGGGTGHRQGQRSAARTAEPATPSSIRTLRDRQHESGSDGHAASRALLVTAAFVIVVAGIKAAEAIMVPFLLAAFIAVVAGTPVQWLEARRCPVGLAISLVMAVIVLALVGIGMLISNSVDAFLASLPFYQERLGEITNAGVAFLTDLGIEVSMNMFTETFDPAMALQMVGTTLRGLGAALSNGFLILLTVIFILAEASSFPSKLRRVLDSPEHELAGFADFADNVNRYMAIKTTISTITGAAIAIWLTILGVDFAILWGLVAFMLNYVPNIGSIIAAIPAVLLALVQLGPIPAAMTAAGYVVVNLVMGNVVEPRYMGRGLGLSTLVVFVSLVFWGWVLGPVGMLLSVPLTMTAKIALATHPSTTWVAHLLGPGDPHSTPARDPEPSTTSP
ncbi:MAG: AI-2E family transporter [Gammaproteobacteria bacterium]|nr:AI-2E family transporter [Gammaproteobacteria bacterium]